MAKPKLCLIFGVRLNPRAECDNCPWKYPESPVARQEAKEHAKATGHTVLVEVRILDRYGVM